MVVNVSYQLGYGQIETLSTDDRFSTKAINLTGNDSSQTIIGNAGSNLIDGRVGDDILNGLDGDDTYYVWTSALWSTRTKAGETTTWSCISAGSATR